jgi:branched-chain amino acid transport system permease protein
VLSTISFRKYRQLIYMLVFLGFLALIPLVTTSFIEPLLVLILIYVTMSQGYNVMLIQGDLSFGPAAFMGGGAYTVALLVHYGVSTNVIINFALAAAVSAVMGLVLGFPLLKLRGIYFAIGTLGLAEIIQLLILATPSMGGGTGIIVTTFVSTYNPNTFYYAIIGITALISVITYFVFISRFGLALTAVRDNVDAARSLGIRATLFRLLGFSLSGALIGIVGAFFAYYNGFVYPDNVLSLNISFTILTIAFFGGQATFLGPIIGGFAVVLAEQIAQNFILQGYQIVLAVILIIVFLVMPGGIVGSITRRAPIINPFRNILTKKKSNR